MITRSSSQKLYCLISVGSSSFSRASVEHLRRTALDLGGNLSFILLDELEAVNIEVFESLSRDQAHKIAKERAEEKHSALGLHHFGAMSWREACATVDFEGWRKEVWELFEKQGSFRRHVLSQTFRNLQPKFEKKGAKKKTDPLVARGASYLLDEIAWKIAAFCGGPFDGEVVPKEENEIVIEIYKGTYFDCPVRSPGFKLIEVNHTSSHIRLYER